MRAMTFERLVKDERFVSPLLTTAVGDLRLRRPDAVAPASTAPKSALKPSPRQQQRDLRQGERAGRGAEASQ